MLFFKSKDKHFLTLLFSVLQQPILCAFLEVPCFATEEIEYTQYNMKKVMSKIFGNFIKLGGSILGQIVGQFGRGADRQIAERAKI